MKIIIGLLAVLSVASCYRRDSDLSSSVSSSKYLEYMRERSQIEQLRRKFQSFCPEKADELDGAIRKLKQCSDAIDENNETICSAVKNHFLKCSKPLIQLLEECMPEESQEIPRLVFNGVNSAVAYLCKTDGEHIFELSNVCVFKSDLDARCERRIRTKLQQYQNKHPSKAEICELAQSMKPCLHKHLQESCGNQITRESFMGMFDALVAPCKITRSNEVDWNHINEVEVVD